MAFSLNTVARRVRDLPALQAFRYRDFRILWLGAFLSFCGSWIQNVAQGWLVFHLTGSEAMLALVTFCNSLPVFVLGPFAGTLADMLNRRIVLVVAQASFACAALFLAIATYFEFVAYWQILVVGSFLGIVSAVEMPARQSLVSTVVPPESIARAVPINAMTFNSARMIGPAIGGLLLARFGPSVPYLINAISFSALIFAVLAIKADLSSVAKRTEPILDLVLGGMRYTFRDRRLRVLFVMETVVSSCGLVYLPLMPAIAKEMLGLGKEGLGIAMTWIGVGAMTGLITLMLLSHRPWKTVLVRIAMTTMGLALLALSFVRIPGLAFVFLAIAGMSGVVQFNTTNTLFQLLSPRELRGRVLSMHIWALSGVGPIGVLLFGWIAQQTTIPLAISLGASVVLLAALISWKQTPTLRGAEDAIGVVEALP